MKPRMLEPDVMQYIQRKAETYEIVETVKAMQRKLQIAEGIKSCCCDRDNETCLNITLSGSLEW
jgi:hypothetical protein|eukprot:scaffold354_cov215-Alexandrium_tamarense.AAC.11